MADIDESDRTVPSRKCSGQPSAGGEPLHQRPAGVHLEMMAIYACDYGVYALDGHHMAPMDMTPFLDAVAARYDNCHECFGQQVARIAESPALTTHVIGVTLLTFSSGLDRAPANTVIYQLDPPGAAIALVMRNYGLLPAVKVAAGLPLDQRRSAAQIAVNQLLPTGWMDTPVSNFTVNVGRHGGKRGEGDDEMLDALREQGLIPPDLTHP